MKKIIAGLGGALMLAAAGAGCSGSSSGPPTLKQAASEADVTLTGTPSWEMFTHQTQDIAGHGGRCEIATFATTSARDNWIKTGSEFGGYVLKQGDLWAVGCI